MSRPLVLVLLILAALVSGAAGWLLRGTPPRPGPVYPETPEDASAADALDAVLRPVRARFERLAPASSDEENALLRPRTPPYRDHLDAADSLGVAPIAGEAEIAAHLRAGRLVPLGDTDLYTVMVLSHSKPFVTPATRAALDRLGQRFQDSLAARGLPRYRLIVTSVARTADLQEDLRTRNRSATSGTSTHEYGVTVDLSHFRFAYHPQPGDCPGLEAAFAALCEDVLRAYGSVYWDHLDGLLTRLLGDLQREGQWLVLREPEQNAFHLTLAR